MSFTRTKEDFVCTHCGARVSGTGYTNHCPECLWSRHMDESPGDRAASCKGMMEPTGVSVSSQKYRIEHTCRTCGAMRIQDAGANDNAERLIALSAQPARVR